MTETPVSERTKTFTKFGDLPAEIRLQIWAYAVHIPNPRDFKIILRRPYESPFKSVSPPPALLHTCHDSRQTLLKTKKYSFHYPKHLIQGSDRYKRLEGPKKVYLDLENDTLFFQTEDFDPWFNEIDHVWNFLKYKIVDSKGDDEFGKGPGELEAMVVKMGTAYKPNTLLVVRKRSHKDHVRGLVENIKTYTNDEREVLERAGYVVGNKVGQWTFKSVAIVKHWGSFNYRIRL